MKRFVKIILFLAVLLLLFPSIPVFAQTTIDGDIGGLDGFGRPPTRHSFFAEGLLWVTYVSVGATDWVYRTSPDYGATFSGETIIHNSVSQAFNCSLYYDGTYVHLVRTSAWDIYYRRATPQSNGTLSYSAAWQQAVNGVGTTRFPTVAPDANGYPFIAYSTNFGAPAYKAIALYSDANDGTWPTPNSNAQDLNASASAYIPLIIPMASGRMLALYAVAGATMRAQMWTGAAWSAEDVGISTVGFQNYSAVNTDDTVHIVFTEQTSEDLIYTTYTAVASDFGSETTVDNTGSGASSKTGSISINPYNYDMFIVAQQCPTADHVYYYKYDYGTSTWEAIVDWIDETVLDGLPVNQFLQNVSFSTVGGLAYFYVADAQQLKFNGLNLLELTTLTPTAITDTSATLRGEITSLGTGSVSSAGWQLNTVESAVGATDVPETGCPCGMGIVSENVTGLTTNQLYYYRFYATDGAGTVYGSWVSFIASSGYGSGNSTPTVNTLPATSIGATSARINGYLQNDGGETCSARLQYRQSGGGTWTNTVWQNGFTTGDYFYSDLTGLTLGQAYDFRAQALNSIGTGNGSILTFTTGSSVGNVTQSSFVAIPRIDAPAIDLTWAKPAGASTVMIRGKIGSYPTSATDGTLVCNTAYNACTHGNLTAGDTWWYAAIGVSGNSSSSSFAYAIATVSLVIATTDMDSPTAPANWLRDVNYTNLSSMPGYGLVNWVGNEFGFNLEFFWGTLGFMIGLATFVVTYIASKGNLLAAAIAGLVILGILVPVGLMAGFIVFIWGFFTTMYGVQKARA